MALEIERVQQIAERVAASSGLELVEVEFRGGGKSRLLRIFIDKPGGVTHEDCAQLSREVSTILDVEDVVPGGAADKAGIKRGDVITAFDGEAVHSSRQFTRLVEEAAPGRAVRGSYVRDGRRTDVTLTPGPAERPATVYIDPERIRERIREAMPTVDMTTEKNYRIWVQ